MVSRLISGVIVWSALLVPTTVYAVRDEQAEVRLPVQANLPAEPSSSVQSERAELLAEAEELFEAAVKADKTGSARSAKAHAKRSFDMREAALGERHALTLDSQYILAKALLRLKENDEAQSQLERNFRLRREVKGLRDPDTLNSLHSWALALFRLERWEEAEPLFARAVQLRREVLGNTSRATLTSLQGHALTLERLGRYAEAEPLYAERLEASIRRSGIKHARNRSTVHDYARILYRLDRFEDAAPYFAQSVELNRTNFGERDGRTLFALDWQASNYEKSDKYEKAADVLDQLLSLHEAASGQRTSAALKVRDRLAQAFSDLGWFDAAAEEYGTNLAIRRELLAPEDGAILSNAQDYASSLANLGRTDQAIDLLEREWTVRKEKLGADHQSTALARFFYALMLARGERHAEAEPLLANEVRLMEQQRDRLDPFLLMLRQNYADSIAGQGRYKQAIDLYAANLKLSREIHGATDSRSLDALNDLAWTYANAWRYEDAIARFEELLALRTQVASATHETTLQTRFDLGQVASEAGQHERALAAFETVEAAYRGSLNWSDFRLSDAVRTRGLTLVKVGRSDEGTKLLEEVAAETEKALGERDPNALKALNDLGLALALTGQYDRAEPILARTVEISRTLKSVEPNSLARTIENYGLAVAGLGKLDEAEALGKEAWTIMQKARGDSDPETLRMLSNYTEMVRRRGRLDEAAELYTKVIASQREALAPEDPSLLENLVSFGWVLHESGKTFEAEPLYREAVRKAVTAHGPRHHLTFEYLTSHAKILMLLRRLDEAEPLMRQAYELSREILPPLHQGRVDALLSYGRVLKRKGRYSEAADLMARAAALSVEVFGENHQTTFETQLAYAEALLAADEAVKAVEKLHELLRFLDPNSNANDAQRLSLSRVATTIALKAKRYDAAREYAREWFTLSTEIRGVAHSTTQQSMVILSNLLRANGETEEALLLSRRFVAQYRSRLTEIQDASLRGEDQAERQFSAGKTIEKSHLMALWSHQASLGALDEALRNEAFESMQNASANTASSAVAKAAAARFATELGLQEIVKEREQAELAWSKLDAELVNERIKGTVNTDRINTLQDQKHAIESSVEEIDRRLKREAPNFFAILAQEPTALSSAREILRADEAILMLVPTAKSAQVMAITRENTAWAEGQTSVRCLDEKVDIFRSGLEVDSSGRLPLFDFTLANELYHELIAPVEAILEGKRRVYIVAEGSLSRLPLGTLLTAPLAGHEPEEGSDEYELPEDETPTIVVTDSHCGSVEFLPGFRIALPSADDDGDKAIARGNTRKVFQSNGASVRATMLGLSPIAPVRTNDPDDFLAAQWLADRYALVTLPSLQSLVYIRTFGVDSESNRGLGYVGFGDPILAAHASRKGTRAAGAVAIDAAEMVGETRSATGVNLMNPASLKRMKSLPGTKDELERVSRLLGASNDTLFLAEQMTEPAIRGADLSQTRILHLATHGLTSEEGNRFGNLAEPGLVFTPPEQGSEANDGYLSASEVVGLDLTLAEWVILSACNTAAPSGQPGQTGLSGLAQAFFYAGAESLLVSHWPVFDSIAPILTAETLRRSEAGMSRAEALQEAMQEVRKTNPHPAAWAPFVLVGEGA